MQFPSSKSLKDIITIHRKVCRRSARGLLHSSFSISGLWMYRGFCCVWNKIGLVYAEASSLLGHRIPEDWSFSNAVVRTSYHFWMYVVLNTTWTVITFHRWTFISVCFINPYPTAFPYGNGMVLHFYQQQESSTTKTVHKVINKGLKTYV